MRLNVAGNACYCYTGSRAIEAGKPTIAFVHGAANDHSVWALQSRYFAHHGHNVLAVDLPGHGRSGGPALTSVEAIADWLALLLDAAGIERTVVIGHSLGSLITLAFAARHSLRVTKAVVLGPAAPMFVSDELLAASRIDEPEAYAMINSWSFSADKQLGGSAVPGLWMTGNSLQLMGRTRPGVLYTDLSACRSYADGLADAARVRCPVLAILGSRDVMTPVKGAQALLAALADPHTVTLAGAGHSMMAEEPDAVLDAMRAFL